jgi:hypothetical protein
MSAQFKKKKVRSITIIGRKWFNKSAGNTYCSSDILINGKHEQYQPIEYGYGSYYEQSAWSWLKKALKVSEEDRRSIWQFCEDNKIVRYSCACDVQKERDL